MLFPGFFMVAKSFAVIDFNDARQEFFGDLRGQVFDATENATAFTYFRFEVFNSLLLIHVLSGSLRSSFRTVDF